MTPIQDLGSAPIGDPRAWLEQHAVAISGLAHRVARRQRVLPQDADELLSTFYAHLMKDDYRALRLYRGTSTLATYLTVILTRLVLDSRTRDWGKWRPTARARALGPAAVAFERLVARDGVPEDEARARTGVSVTDGVTAPVRRSARHLQPLAVADAVAAPSEWWPSAALEGSERRASARSVRDSLKAVVASLTDSERELLRLRHVTGLTITNIAAVCGLPHKGLYRCYERLYLRLRVELEELGVSPVLLRTVLGSLDAWVDGVLMPYGADVAGVPGAASPSRRTAR